MANNTARGVKGFLSVPLEHRFWDKVDKREDDDCWPWKGACTGGGYGQIWVNGRSRRAHLVAWELFNGSAFPIGVDGCHSCDNPPCCNPAHIWPGTKSQNMLDAQSKGRLRQPTTGKTHCPQGHPYEGKNLYISNSPNHHRARICRTCQAFHNRQWRARKKLLASRLAAKGAQP